MAAGIRVVTNESDASLDLGHAFLRTLMWVVLAVPALFIAYHFFARMCGSCFARMTGGSGPKLALVVALTAYWFFAFYGGDGTSGDYGPVTQFLAITSKYFLFPLAIMWLWARYGSLARTEQATHA